MNAVALLIVKKNCYKNRETFKSSKSSKSYVTILRFVSEFCF